MAPLTIGTPHPDAAPGTVRIEGLRDARYGEVFLARATPEGTILLEIWNTIGQNDCPQDAWDALEATELAADHDALVAVLNGPRHWLLDSIENVPSPDRRIATFGDLDMTLVATVDLGTEAPVRAPYTQRRINRSTVWEWSAGRVVHELLDAEGHPHVMQAYCVGVDPTLTEATLTGVGDKLTLPDGWSYRSRTLDTTLRLQATDGVAVIIQDDLENTYQRV